MDDTPYADVLGSYGRNDPGAASRLLTETVHELRTPLTSILVYAWLLADNPHQRLSDEEVGFATGIQLAGGVILQRFNDLLDLPNTS